MAKVFVQADEPNDVKLGDLWIQPNGDIFRLEHDEGGDDSDRCWILMREAASSQIHAHRIATALERIANQLDYLTSPQTGHLQVEVLQ